MHLKGACETRKKRGDTAGFISLFTQITEFFEPVSCCIDNRSTSAFYLSHICGLQTHIHAEWYYGGKKKSHQELKAFGKFVTMSSSCSECHLIFSALSNHSNSEAAYSQSITEPVFVSVPFFFFFFGHMSFIFFFFYLKVLERINLNEEASKTLSDFSHSPLTPATH